MHRLVWLLPTLSLSASSAARADTLASPALSPAPPGASRGVELGARVGYAFPMGTLTGGSGSAPLDQMETGAVPLSVDAGYRLTPRTYLGGVFTWAPGTQPGNGPCPSTDSCSAQSFQIRGDARTYLGGTRYGAGWASAGLGWEVATFGERGSSQSITSTLTGPLLDLELGYEGRPGGFTIGPYVGATMGVYVTQGIDPAAGPFSTAIHDAAPHEWVTVGLRGGFGPW